MPKAQVISFINMKGGVGKTTCAVNIATYLARDHGKRVLLVDFDPQTNASLSVMTEKAWEKWQDEHGTMADVLEVQWKKKNAEHAKLKDCIIHDVLPEVPGLDLIPSHLSLTFLDLDLAARPGRERIFGRKVEKVLEDYDFILCDCAPNLMTGTQNPDAAGLSQLHRPRPAAGSARLFEERTRIQNPLPRRRLHPRAALAALPPGNHGAPARRL
jgi:chromosome partitioning protein